MVAITRSSKGARERPEAERGKKKAGLVRQLSKTHQFHPKFIDTRRPQLNYHQDHVNKQIELVLKHLFWVLDPHQLPPQYF